MYKKLIFSLAIIAAVFTIYANAHSMDYSAMTTEELSTLRGTLSNASEAERNAFRSEWQKRVNQMTPEELEQYTGPPAGKGSGKGYGKGKGGYGKGKGTGMGTGSGQAGNN